MTHEDETEPKRPSVGTKVLVFGCAILGVLGSFWGIVWFIRSYVEPPRVMLPAPISLAASESKPAPDPSSRGLERQPEAASTRNVETTPARPAPAKGLMAAAQAGTTKDDATPTGGIADRWAPLGSAPAAEPALAPSAWPAPRGLVETPAEPATLSAPAALETQTGTEPATEEVAEGTIPATSGRAPLPRRKPMMAAVAKRTAEPPLPRPRPDGPAPQSVWTAAPTTDDRYQANQ